jgi:hypothetical protein
MNEVIAAIDGLIEKINGEKNRTPHLDIASGRLDAARKHLVAHGEDLARLKEAKAAALKEKTAEVEKLAREIEPPTATARRSRNRVRNAP